MSTTQLERRSRAKRVETQKVNPKEQSRRAFLLNLAVPGVAMVAAGLTLPILLRAPQKKHPYDIETPDDLTSFLNEFTEPNEFAYTIQDTDRIFQITNQILSEIGTQPSPIKDGELGNWIAEAQRLASTAGLIPHQQLQVIPYATFTPSEVQENPINIAQVRCTDANGSWEAPLYGNPQQIRQMVQLSDTGFNSFYVVHELAHRLTQVCDTTSGTRRETAAQLWSLNFHAMLAKSADTRLAAIGRAGFAHGMYLIAQDAKAYRIATDSWMTMTQKVEALLASGGEEMLTEDHLAIKKDVLIAAHQYSGAVMSYLLAARTNPNLAKFTPSTDTSSRNNFTVDFHYAAQLLQQIYPAKTT